MGEKKSVFDTEQKVQDWLELVISNGQLNDLIEGKESVREALSCSESADFKPPFPIDYLTRLGNLRAAEHVLASLHDLDLVSKSSKSISIQKGERLFVDLLYCSRETSRFVIFEIKNQDGSSREAVTEIVAYEQEALNHIPFASADDVVVVVLSRKFSTLLDHAITGLNTWSRRRILCLRFDDSEEPPRLVVHIPKAWSAVGQSTLSEEGVTTATLSLIPDAELDEDDVRSLFSTAANLLVREAERLGGAGFAIVAYNHLYPRIADSPFLIIMGVINPFSFLEKARAEGFVRLGDSPISDYILDDERSNYLSGTWSWLSRDGGAAFDYLSAYGSPSWALAPNWEEIRGIERWRQSALTLDRHIMPVSIDYWGALGDYARDAVRHVERMRNFMPSLARPGIDWRHPLFGVVLLDEVALKPRVAAGQWTFSSLFELGMLLGRFGAISAQFKDADTEQRRMLQAGAFWAEADLVAVLEEVRLRYMSTPDIAEPPPLLALNSYQNGEAVHRAVTGLVEWLEKHFIGLDDRFMVTALRVGWQIYPLFDPQYNCSGNREYLEDLEKYAVGVAIDWLKMSVVAATGSEQHSTSAAEAIFQVFGELVPISLGENSASAAVDSLDSSLLIDKLFRDIPAIVDIWHPQLAHRLAPVAPAGHDWDWIESEVSAARSRGEKNPCVFVGAGGQIAVGLLPPDAIVPAIDDVNESVLLASNFTGFEIVLPVSWQSLREGKAPGLSPV